MYKKVKNNNKRERIESIERIEDFKIEHGSFEKVQSSDSCTVNFPVIMLIDHNKTFVTSKEVFYSEDCKIE